MRGADDRGGAAFVARVAPGVHEADGDRLNTLGHQGRGLARDRGLVQRLQFRAVDVEPPRHFEAQLARHQRGRGFEKKVVEIVARLLADLDGIAEALGGQQADLAAGALDDGVGHERRAMHHGMQRGRRQARFLEQAGDAGDDRLGRVVGRGQALAGGDQVARGIVQDEVGEGAADVDTDAGRVRHFFTP